MATPLIGDIVGTARTILQDWTQPYRYTDAQMVDGMNNALREARAVRPDLFYRIGLRAALPTYQAPADLLTAFPLEEEYAPSFAAYLIGWAETREDTFTTDGRAALFLRRFRATLLSVGDGAEAPR